MTTFALQHKTTMKKLVTAILVIIFAISAQAQRHHEFGIFAGTSYYLGELNPTVQFKDPFLAYGLVYRYAVNPYWTFKLSGFQGTVEGDDATNPDESRQAFNLSFRSPITEVSAQAELNFFRYVTGSDNYRFSPFLFAGVSVFHFNPMAEFEGNWYDLQPLGTEGQGTTAYPDRKHYSLTTISVPFGLGIKLSISNNLAFALEWGLRMTFTDYLDDISTTYADPFILKAENSAIAQVLGNRAFEVPGYNFGAAPTYEQYPELIAATWKDKQRGNAENNDWYSFAGATLTFKIKPPKSKTCPAYDTYFKYREYYLF